MLWSPDGGRTCSDPLFVYPFQRLFSLSIMGEKKTLDFKTRRRMHSSHYCTFILEIALLKQFCFGGAIAGIMGG